MIYLLTNVAETQDVPLKPLLILATKKVELMTLLIFVQLVTCSMCRNW